MRRITKMPQNKNKYLRLNNINTIFYSIGEKASFVPRFKFFNASEHMKYKWGAFNEIQKIMTKQIPFLKFYDKSYTLLIKNDNLWKNMLLKYHKWTDSDHTKDLSPAYPIKFDAEEEEYRKQFLNEHLLELVEICNNPKFFLRAYNELSEIYINDCKYKNKNHCKQ